MRHSATNPCRRRRAALALLVPLAFTLGLAGCGDSVPPAGSMHQVKGKVIFSKPEAVSGLKIYFLPSGGGARSASGQIKPDGTFELTTKDPGDGIAEGDYKVRLGQPIDAKGKPAASPIPSEYFDEDGALLSAQIKPDTTEIPPFELKPITGKGGKPAKQLGRSND